jgi:hypothetical protein
VKLAVAAAGAVLTLTAVTGCTLSGSTSTAAGSAVQSQGSGLSQPDDGGPGPSSQLINPASVTITTCHLGRMFGHLAARFQGEVTNTTTLTGSVSVGVFYLDRDGTVGDIGYEVADNIPPGGIAHFQRWSARLTLGVPGRQSAVQGQVRRGGCPLTGRKYLRPPSRRSLRHWASAE